MILTLRYFAALRELIGREQEQVELPDGATIADLRASLTARYAASDAVLARCVAARNRVYAADETVLAAGDEVVFIPPMAGG
jgi:molybdopterin converting factor subunit 1